jgi:arginyl-tRNA synthetase
MVPRQKEHGDFATNIALKIAALGGSRPPREVAEVLRSAIPSSDLIEKTEVAGPGFINLFTTDAWLHDVLREAASSEGSYGRVPFTGRRVQVEFVSANPTGPLTVAHARNAAIGDALARILSFTGWRVQREYYFNDAGGQMDRFGASVEARYLEQLGMPSEVPDDGYHGAYVKDLAQDILRHHGSKLADLPGPERLVQLRTLAVERVLDWIKSTLDRFGVVFDSFVSERDLSESGRIGVAITRLQESGHAYEHEGAIWFRSTDFGDDKDRVLVRSNGEHTYFAADCAYVIDKFERGFDHLIYVWGADHHGTVVRLRGAAEALGFDPETVEIVLYQWVSFVREGEPVPMSKRAGNFLTLDQLIDEVGADAARFHLLMFSNDSAMNFDIESVKEHSLDNPVYYVQYGHARISSILRKAKDRGVLLRPIQEADLRLLVHETELDLLRAIAEVPSQILTAADRRNPSRLPHMAQELAARFHRFYTECLVVSEDAPLTQARLWLCVGTKNVIATVLELLGVSAPESMERLQ